jgi:tetratricopeptide (TPR) repeat protein
MTGSDDLERLFFLLLEIDADQRSAILAQESVSPEMRRKLEQMLALDQAHTDGALKQPLNPALRPEFQPGERFDGFEVIEHIAGGGMGDVYLARQTNPSREVALKVIRQGMATESLLARFKLELQALARMDHSSVARVYGAGVTPRGRPYFTMEFVRGEPITEYCDEQGLGTRDRVKVFLQVCDGVQHAHQNAILHRDLKPSNVLVTRQDGEALPKIIDFGVAKATEGDLSDSAFQTEHGMLIGTPEYMSPEQANMAGGSVDTRSDVYSLGVILYELLCGLLPFSPEELRTSGYDSIQRIIREKVPARPSTQVGSYASGKLPDVGKTALKRELSGDLDWIVMKALEKEPGRRYGSPSDLAADLRRYLANEPVMAGPPGAGYRVRKFIRRHTLSVSLAGAGIVILVVFAGTMTFQAQRIATERDRADEAAAVARDQAETAQRVSELMVELFASSDPAVARGTEPTVRELLDAGAERVLNDLGDEPVVQARLLATIGDSYRALGLWEKSTSTLETALDITVATFGEESIETANAKTLLAYPLIHQASFERAERICREALATMRRLLPEDDPAIAVPIRRLAFSTIRAQRDVGPMVPLLQEALAVQRKAYGDAHLDLAGTLDLLGMVQASLNNVGEAEAAYLEAAEMLDELVGGLHPRAGYVLTHYLSLLLKLGRFEEALEPARENLALMLDLYGPRHPEVAYAKIMLSQILWRNGQVEEATVAGRESMELMREFTGPDDMEYANSAIAYATALVAAGRLEQAARMYVEAEQIVRTNLDERHPFLRRTLRERAEIAHHAGDSELAEALLLEALEKHDVQPPDSGGDAADRAFLAMVYMDQDRLEGACSLAQASSSGFEQIGVENGRGYIHLARAVLGRCLALDGDLERAGPLLRESLMGLEAWYVDGHPTLEAGRRYARVLDRESKSSF